jgi:hypothetical protein
MTVCVGEQLSASLRECERDLAVENQICDLDYCVGRKNRACTFHVRRGPGMDDGFYRGRARVLRELAMEADPLIKRRLLRLANNYDDMITTKTPRDQTGQLDQNVAAEPNRPDG